MRGFARQAAAPTGTAARQPRISKDAHARAVTLDVIGRTRVGDACGENESEGTGGGDSLMVVSAGIE
jgi:hypothetical protein